MIRVGSASQRLRVRGNKMSLPPCLRGERTLQPRLDPVGQRAEIRHALQFIVRQLDAKVMLELGQQIEGLQAVDAKRLEEVIVGRELLPRHLEMRGRELEDFIERLVGRWHREVSAFQITNHKSPIANSR